MGFVKDSGKSLFGGDYVPEPDVLKKEIEDLGGDATGVEISVEGDTVKL
ncbi:MAG: hypothetical protein ABJL99_26070 [Aliishimia sp.]